jgi:hypothetical protein
VSYGVGSAYRALTMKCVEPQQRNKDGMRWISHRFEIKGGISLRDVMAMSSRNVLLTTCDIEGRPVLTFRGIPVVLDA